jgi:hypothetical protein
MSFADVEARMNASVFRTLTNASAVYTPAVGDPVTFPVVFDPAGGLVDEFGTIAQMPRFTMQPAELSNLEEGMVLSIRSASYTVRSVVPLDEGGWQRVTLARAA